MAEKICAYLDLLGFKHHIKTESQGALRMLNNYQQIIDNKIFEKSCCTGHPSGVFSINNITENNLVDSFENFIPFSDSIFITGSEPDKFITQISNFILESFEAYSSYFANPKCKENPTIYVVSKIITDREGNIRRSESEQIAFPVLFRGGIAYDEVFDIKTNYIYKNENQILNSITGMGIIKAVGLEDLKFKGPRIFCNKNFIDKLGTEVEKMFISPIEESDDIFELLWPISKFHQNETSEYEIGEFDRLFHPALNLWRAFNHEEFGIHYYKLMKLIIKSALHYFKLKSYENESIDYITEILIKANLGIKIKDLIESKYV
jgi:hypothetical protein